MTRSLRALLEGLIDYSGFAPPAALPIDETVHNSARYLAGEYRWLLGRSIVPLARLGEYESALSALDGRETGNPWKLSGLTTGEAAADIELIAEFHKRHGSRFVIDTVELKAGTPAAIRALRPTVPAAIHAFVEIPAEGNLAELTATLAASGLRAKMRTGGLTADGIPATDSVARFIVACNAARIPYKFTAGMHAPLRSIRKLTYAIDSPTTMMHGFINAFLAGALAHHGADGATVRAVLDEQSPGAFEFTDEHAAWRDRKLTVEQIIAARQFVRSLGSCSFTEPIEGLQEIGWI